MADAGRRPQMRRTEVGVEVGLARLVRQAADEDLARALRRVLARGLPTIAGIKHQRVALHAGEVLIAWDLRREPGGLHARQALHARRAHTGTREHLRVARHCRLSFHLLAIDDVAVVHHTVRDDLAGVRDESEATGETS